MSVIFSVVDALHSGDPALVTASSLGRVWQHVKNAPEKPFAILTSWRVSEAGADGSLSPVSPQQNAERLRALKDSIRRLGLGYIQLVGNWDECQDPNIPYEECPPEKKVLSSEPSLFVPGLSRQQAQRFASQYNQDSFIYAGPDTGDQVTLVFTKGGEQAVGSRFKLRSLEQAFSELSSGSHAGRRFVFASLATDSPGEARAAAAYEDQTYGRRLYNCLTGGRLGSPEQAGIALAAQALRQAATLLE